MAALPIGLEGAAFTTAYSVPTTTPEYPGAPFLPGTVAAGTDGSEWIFVKLAASQTIAAGDFVYVSSTDTTFVVTSLANAAKALLGAWVGVAGAASTSGTTSTNYIWIQRKGYYATAAIATAASQNALLHTTTTAGRLASASSGGVTATVAGVVSIVAASSNVGAVMLNYPTISTAD